MGDKRSATLDPDQMAAWQGLRRVHDVLVRRIGAEIERQHGMTLTEYEVLRCLAEAQGRRLPLGSLAEAVQLTPSGITRLVDRLERRGLLQRRPDGDDGRRWHAALTGAGQTAVRAADRTHSQAVRSAFVDRVGREGSATLLRIWSRLDA